MTLKSCTMAAALLASLALVPAAAMADQTVSTVAVPPFYQGVMKMKPEGKLGQVLKQERIATPIPGAEAWRIAYVSSDLNDTKTISTALVVAPAGKAPKGGRPVITWSHGTTGTAANCGPSQIRNPAKPLNLYFRVGGDSWTDYGLPALEQFIKAGYVVVGTDYQGLGSPGKHHYAVARTNGRDAINAARAVGTMKQTGAGKKVVAIGWSQGGGSTIAAAGQADYIALKGTARDGIDVVGYVAMAPEDVAAMGPDKINEANAEQLIGSVAKAFSGNVFDFSHFAMNMWGIEAAFPDKLKLTDLFTEEGAKALDDIFTNKCVHAISDTISYTYGKDFGKLMRSDPQNALAWAQAVQDISVVNDVKPAAPVMIYFGDNDTTLPPIQHELYRKKMCAIAGANVGRMQLPGTQDHFSTPGASEQFYLPWIADRFAGKPAPDGCAAN
jgi:pimeloyl-ACP methyl ester carboxylesterase